MAAVGRRPSVWVLADHKLGHTRQSIALADELGWPYVVKQLAFNDRRRRSNTLLGASLTSLDLDKSSPISPPWPDLVIATGRAAAPIARWIKSQNPGTKLVQLGRRGTDQRAGSFDLAVACGFFGLPPHPNRMETVAPISAIPPDDMDRARARWRDLFSGDPRPHVALLVGGSTKASLLDASVAAEMSRRVGQCSSGGTLLVVTSPRTGASVTAAIAAELAQHAPHARLYEWKRADPDNPYLGCLAVADVLVVTGDSESMIAEAAATEKPLYIYPLPELAGNWRRKVRARVARGARNARSRVIRPFAQLLLERGLVRPPRELSELHRQLVDRGCARMFGGALDVRPRAALSEVSDVAARVRSMMGPAMERR